MPAAGSRTSESLWTPERVTATPRVVTCGLCGMPLTVPSGLEVPRGETLTHEVCPPAAKPERLFEVRLQLVDVTQQRAVCLMRAFQLEAQEILDRNDERIWTHDVRLEDELAGFVVHVADTTLQGAIAKAVEPLGERWNQLHAKAPLADA